MNFFLIAVRVSLSQPLSERQDYGYNSPDVEVGKVIKKPGKDEWCVKSEKNSDWSGGCYPSKSKAEKRLRQVEYWKHSK